MGKCAFVVSKSAGIVLSIPSSGTYCRARTDIDEANRRKRMMADSLKDSTRNPHDRYRSSPLLGFNKNFPCTAVSGRRRDSFMFSLSREGLSVRLLLGSIEKRPQAMWQSVTRSKMSNKIHNATVSYEGYFNFRQLQLSKVAS